MTKLRFYAIFLIKPWVTKIHFRVCIQTAQDTNFFRITIYSTIKQEPKTNDTSWKTIYICAVDMKHVKANKNMREQAKIQRQFTPRKHFFPKHNIHAVLKTVTTSLITSGTVCLLLSRENECTSEIGKACCQTKKPLVYYFRK